MTGWMICHRGCPTSAEGAFVSACGSRNSHRETWIPEGALPGVPAGSGPRRDTCRAFVSGLSRQDSMYRRMNGLFMRQRLRRRVPYRGPTQPEKLAHDLRRDGRKDHRAAGFPDLPDCRAQGSGSGRTRGKDIFPWIPGCLASRSCSGCWRLKRRPLRVAAGTQFRARARRALAHPGHRGRPGGGPCFGYLLRCLTRTSATPDDADLLVTSYAQSCFAITLARTRTSLENSAFLALRGVPSLIPSSAGTSWTAKKDRRTQARIIGRHPTHKAFRVGGGTGKQVPAWRSPSRGASTTRKLAEELLPGRAGFTPVCDRYRGPELVLLLPEGQAPRLASRGRRAQQENLKKHISPNWRPHFSCSFGTRPDPGPRLPGLQERNAVARNWLPQALGQAQHAIDIGIGSGGSARDPRVNEEKLAFTGCYCRSATWQQLWPVRKGCPTGPLIELRRARTRRTSWGHCRLSEPGARGPQGRTGRVLHVHVKTP